MATTTASKYVVNIVELQNTITSASGLSPVATLSNTVAQLQEMVIYDEKRIAVNTISKYSQSPIQVTDSMNFASNATLSVNGVGVGAGTSDTSFGSVSSIGYASSFTNYFSTVVAGETAISFQVGSPAATPVRITADGDTVISGGLTLSGAGTPGLGYYLTCLDTVGTAEWRVPGSVSDLRWEDKCAAAGRFVADFGGDSWCSFRVAFGRRSGCGCDCPGGWGGVARGCAGGRPRRPFRGGIP